MVLQQEANAPYRGPDRRGRNDGLGTPIPPRRVVLVTLLIFAGAGGPALFLVPRHPGASTMGAYAAIAASLLFVVAGCTRLVAWRIAGRAVLGWLASASIVFGVIIVVSEGLPGIGLNPIPPVRPAGELVGTLIAGWLVWRGLTDREVNAAFSPLMALCWGTGVGLFLVGLLNAIQVNGLMPAWLTGSGGSSALAAASACIWATVGVLGWRAVGNRPQGLTRWGVTATGLLALSFLARAASSQPWASTIASSVCLLYAAAIALATHINRLQELLRSGDRAQRRLQLALADSLHQAASERQNLEEWLHDVRNAVAGLQAADAVLHDRAHAGVDGRPELADAVTAELARLHALVDPARHLRLSNIDLATAIQPVVAAERALGTQVNLCLQPGVVRGDPEALGRVVQNVLTNARRYAPGSPVVISCEFAGGHVQLFVRDGGPGVPPSERVRAFERGMRGSGSAGIDGNGLGLYVARTLMRAMGGDIWMEPGDGPGCCVVLSLPSPVPERHAAPAGAAAWTVRHGDLERAG